MEQASTSLPKLDMQVISKQAATRGSLETDLVGAGGSMGSTSAESSILNSRKLSTTISEKNILSAISEGISCVGVGDKPTSMTLIGHGKQDMFEGPEREPAPLTPEKCDIVDKEAMNLKLISVDNKVDNKVIYASPSVAVGSDALSDCMANATPSGTPSTTSLLFMR